MSGGALDLYVCPGCHGELQPQAGCLYCAACGRTYPVQNDIPDFLLVRPEDSSNPILRDIDQVGRMARWYESWFWYPLVLSLYAGWRVLTFDQILAYVRERITPLQGLVLDVATGTATYGRRVVGPGRTVYGIDISLDMMRVGQGYVRREGLSGMHFSRADVEALPFGDGLFDGCITGGSLHLFPDPLRALTEIGRTLKPGAPLVVVTFTWSRSGILRYERVRRRIREQGRFHPFELAALKEHVERAGFTQYEPDVRGGAVLFTARRR